MLAPPEQEPPLWKRLAWMAGLWLASISFLGAIAWVIKLALKT